MVAQEFKVQLRVLQLGMPVVVEVHDDHLCAVTSPVEFSRVTSELVQHVLHA